MKRILVCKWATCMIALLLVFYLCYLAKIDYNEETIRQLFLTSIPHNLSKKPVTSEATCGCNRTLSGIESHERSTCDYYASMRGHGQKVISFSFYGNDNFFKGIRSNLVAINEIYPGWLVRVYHSADTGDNKVLETLCQLWCDFPYLDLCQVGRLPLPLGDQSTINGMIWRFFPLGDPLVERFMVRDLDSVIGLREAAAVAQWIKSNYTWHFMHDHPQHATPILGGMWGALNRDLKVATNLRQQLISGGTSYSKGSDQILLAKYLKPIAEKTRDYIDHSSYLCGKYLEMSTPWPTRRASDLDYVGRNVADKGGIKEACPERCRPSNHLDWTYC